MINRIFIDSDVIVDLLSQRHPFYEDVISLFRYLRNLKLSIGHSVITVTNANYLLCKFHNKEIARRKVSFLLRLSNTEMVNLSMINDAINSDFTDLEDAIQHYCAKAEGYDCIITRNVKDYKYSQLPVFTPREFLARYNTIFSQK